ncbi:MAG: alpha/beta hydrolase [Sulfurovum sp.]|nr:MAG: alpha/beta hydrolase [Sulfurovum sp.]
MKHIVKKVSLLLLFIYIGLGVFLYLNQRSFLYFPTPNNATAYNTMSIQNDGENINIILLNEGHKNAILYFGGNAESMAGSADYIAKQFPHFTVYLMDYRGYGESTGVATEQTLYKDALKLYDSIKKKHERISLGGRSLGSGIATYVAEQREVSKLVLITPFDSILSVAQARFPFYPVYWLLDERYDSASRAKEIRAETLVIMAELDRVIPKVHTQKLIDAFDVKQLKVIVIKNRGHIDISSDERYYKSVQDFIGEG